MSELNYDFLVKAANNIRQALNSKPLNQKIGYQISPGGILNAYREGDINFKEACKRIEELINPQNSEGSGTQPTASNSDLMKLLCDIKTLLLDVDIPTREQRSDIVHRIAQLH